MASGNTGAAASPQAATGASVNSVPIVVQSVFSGGYNRPLITVTLCAPGTTTCQTIDKVLVDTGSTGFRIMSKAVDPALKLPQVADGLGRSVGQCSLFGRSAVAGKVAHQAFWGSVHKADLKIGGMTAPGVSVELDSDAAFAPIPPACVAAADVVMPAFGFNAILGIRGFDANCPSCAAGVPTTPLYYGCNSSACEATPLPLDQQLRNPVALFGPGYDNGTVITLPPVNDISYATVQGTLTFGIGTQPNNQLGNAKVFRTDSQGYLGFTHNGAEVRALLDTGAADLSFHDDSIPRCADPLPTSYYCPPVPQGITAILRSTEGLQDTISLVLVKPPVSGPSQVSLFGQYIESSKDVTLGLPFYFGRAVFTAITGKATPAGAGPYIAY